ncbi:hypothetical protein M0813_12396 [Anaeramoeba flamelloides]|uniref:Uncharacterized protein n=1 Tax=Anaeramoeba flamelloides TaxID=1746091 RepID=A0ABQ8ZC21_9EUKA|nr:hypothetical protein M0813_12396 [Anaeramoeba flamelloides]
MSSLFGSSIFLIPLSLERFQFFALTILFDSFFTYFLLLPLHLVFSIIRVTLKICRLSKRVIKDEFQFLVHTSLFLITTILMFQIDASRLYHLIKSQSFIKFFALYRLFDMFHKLLSVFGVVFLDSLSASCQSNFSFTNLQTFVLYYLAGLIYSLVHASLYLMNLVTLHICVHSQGWTLVPFFLSTQTSQIKSIVFKRFGKQNVFQIVCADLVARMQLIIFFFIIVMRDFFTNQFHLNHRSIRALFAIILIETAGRWIKQYFLLRFNQHKRICYNFFAYILANDFLSNYCNFKKKNTKPKASLSQPNHPKKGKNKFRESNFLKNSSHNKGNLFTKFEKKLINSTQTSQEESISPKPIKIRFGISFLPLCSVATALICKTLSNSNIVQLSRSLISRLPSFFILNHKVKLSNKLSFLIPLLMAFYFFLLIFSFYWRKLILLYSMHLQKNTYPKKILKELETVGRWSLFGKRIPLY